MLNSVLKLINKDVKEIERLSYKGKLPRGEAITLVKYSEALLKIVKDIDNQEASEQQRMANMTDEELAEKAKQYMDKVKK